MGIGERIIRALKLIEPRDKLIMVKSWTPRYDGRYWCWPTMLVDHYASYRSTCSPCWERNRLRLLFGLKGDSQ